MINRHLAHEDSPYTNSCLFTLDRLPLLLWLRKNISNARDAPDVFSSPKTSQLSVRKPYRPLLLFNSPWEQSVLWIPIFVYKIILYLVSSYSPFFSNFKISTNVKTPKRELGSFFQRYSFKFRALQSVLYKPWMCVLSEPWMCVGLGDPLLRNP